MSSKDSFESRLAQVFGGLEEAASKQRVPGEKKSEKVTNAKPWVPSWTPATPPRLSSPESDDGIDAALETASEKTLADELEPLVPGFVQNPRKWTKYTLAEDDGNRGEFEGLSGDQMNEQVAFQFLTDLRKRKMEAQVPRLEGQDDDEDEEQEEVVQQSTEKIVYQRPNQAPQPSMGGLPAQKSSTAGRALVMPQYEFGSKSIQKRTKVGFQKLHESDDEAEGEDPEERGGLAFYEGVKTQAVLQLSHIDHNDSDSNSYDGNGGGGADSGDGGSDGNDHGGDGGGDNFGGSDDDKGNLAQIEHFRHVGSYSGNRSYEKNDDHGDTSDDDDA